MDGWAGFLVKVSLRIVNWKELSNGRYWNRIQKPVWWSDRGWSRVYSQLPVVKSRSTQRYCPHPQVQNVLWPAVCLLLKAPNYDDCFLSPLASLTVSDTAHHYNNGKQKHNCRKSNEKVTDVRTILISHKFLMTNYSSSASSASISESSNSTSAIDGRR